VDDVLMVLAYVVKHPYQTQPEIRMDLPFPRGLSSKTENYLHDLRNASSPGRPPRSPRGQTPSRFGKDDADENNFTRKEEESIHPGRIFNLAPLELSELSRENSGSSVPGIA